MRKGRSAQNCKHVTQIQLWNILHHFFFTLFWFSLIQLWAHISHTLIWSVLLLKEHHIYQKFNDDSNASEKKYFNRKKNEHYYFKVRKRIWSKWSVWNLITNLNKRCWFCKIIQVRLTVSVLRWEEINFSLECMYKLLKH